MKAEYVNPFYQATRDVFKLMLDLEITRGQLEIAPCQGQEVAVSIGLTGDITGLVIFSFPRKTTLEIVKIMSGMEINKLDGFVTSALGEMANIISGNAVTFLAKEHYQCDIRPPRIVISENQDTPQAAKQSLTIPLQTAVGSLNLNIALEENR